MASRLPKNAIGALALLLAGCTHWNAPLSLDKKWLPSPKLAPDGAVLEIAMLDVPPDDPWDPAELWNEVDEQFLPADVRRRLADHGIRCGLLGAQVPDTLWRRMNADQSITLDNKDGAAVLSDVPSRRRLQCRGNRQQWIVVRKDLETLTLGKQGTGQVEPEEFRDAACELSFKTLPLGDGHVRLDLTCAVRHGPQLQRWVGEDGSFRLDSNRACRLFEGSRFEASLAPGRTLVIGATPAGVGLGGAFFAANPAKGSSHKILFVRLAASQLDDLFSPQQRSTPIVTAAP